jgi:hypothetical protein
MWVKILAGAVAAVTVAGTGTYFAMHGTCGPCPLSGNTDSHLIESDIGSSDCCCCLQATDAPSCTGDSAACPNASPDGVAACVGTTAFLPTTVSLKPAGMCCSE